MMTQLSNKSRVKTKYTPIKCWHQIMTEHKPASYWNSTPPADVAFKKTTRKYLSSWNIMIYTLKDYGKIKACFFFSWTTLCLFVCLLFSCHGQSALRLWAVPDFSEWSTRLQMPSTKWPSRWTSRTLWVKGGGKEEGGQLEGWGERQKGNTSRRRCRKGRVDRTEEKEERGA